MLRCTAKERAEFLLDMADCEEKQRNIKPAPQTRRELEVEEERAARRLENRNRYFESVLPILQMRAAQARQQDTNTKVVITLALIQEHKSRPAIPEEIFKNIRSESWIARRTGGWFHFMKTERFARLMNAARTALQRGRSETANSMVAAAGQ